ncbi:468_t:CDS:2, partial [Acaulospora colombiana]
MSDNSDGKKTTPHLTTTEPSEEHHVEIPILEEHDRTKKSSKPGENLLSSLIPSTILSHVGPKRKSFAMDIGNDGLEVKEIIVIEIEDHRSLHLLNQEDKKVYERMKEWMEKNPKATLQDTADQFSSERSGDAIAKVLHNFQFPDYMLKFRLEKHDILLKFRHEEYEKRELERQRKRRNFERLLLRAGLIIEVENDAANNEDFFVKIYAPFQKLCEEAQQIKLKMRLNMESMAGLDIVEKKSTIYSNITKHFSHSLNLKKQAAFFKVDKLSQFEGGERNKSMGEIMVNFFSTARRNLLVHRMIVTANQINSKHVVPNEAPIMVKKKISSLAIKRLIDEKVYTKYYPLHD